MWSPSAVHIYVEQLNQDHQVRGAEDLGEQTFDTNALTITDIWQLGWPGTDWTNTSKQHMMDVEDSSFYWSFRMKLQIIIFYDFINLKKKYAQFDLSMVRLDENSVHIRVHHTGTMNVCSELLQFHLIRVSLCIIIIKRAWKFAANVRAILLIVEIFHCK